MGRSPWGPEITSRILSLNLSQEQLLFLASYPDEGAKCYLDYWEAPSTKGVHCSATWDSVLCWPPTPANQTATHSCIEVIGIKNSTLPASAFRAKAFRVCQSDGTWFLNRTNYSECLEFLDEPSSNLTAVDTIAYVMFIGSMMSVIALTVTLFIFTYFKSLRCDRISIHKHLCVALLIRVVVNVILTEPVVFGRQSGHYSAVDWLCRLILVMKMYSTLASVNWMFVEGLYLHSRVATSVFDTKSPFFLYYGLGWGIPCILITVWSIVMAFHHPQHCWQGYGSLWVNWILIAPLCIALGMNLLFLINIIRILVTKLRASVSMETTQARKAIKATAVLFPLLGLPNLFVCVNPKDKGDLEHAYLYTNTILDSSQGIFVAVLYCFTNSEVTEAIKKEYERLKWRLTSGVGSDQRRKSRNRLSVYADKKRNSNQSNGSALGNAVTNSTSSRSSASVPLIKNDKMISNADFIGGKSPFEGMKQLLFCRWARTSSTTVVENGNHIFVDKLGVPQDPTKKPPATVIVKTSISQDTVMSIAASQDSNVPFRNGSLKSNNAATSSPAKNDECSV